MKKLMPSEEKLIGSWFIQNGKMVQDPVCERIQWLIDECLKQIAIDERNWSILYQDKEDRRYWELTYPQSHMHGGGPPTLSLLSSADAKVKYKV